jgi:lipopolysaccharide transport system permease protein
MPELDTTQGVARPLALGVRREPEWVENRPSQRWLPRLDFTELWNYRELGWAFAQKTLRVRYKQTAFGVSWAVIQPLAAVLVFTVVFGRLVKLPTDGIPYTVFSYAGMIIWLYVSSIVGGAAQSLVENRDLVTKVYFPRLLAPLSAAIPGLVDLAIAFLVLIVMMVVLGVAPGPAVVLLPLWILAALVTGVAMGTPLAALNVKYRDVRVGLPLVLQVWLYGSPVAYSASLFKGVWSYVYALNPVVTVLDGFRWSIAHGPPPGPQAFVSLVVVVVVGAAGIVYFRRVERSFADVV